MCNGRLKYKFVVVCVSLYRTPTVTPVLMFSSCHTICIYGVSHIIMMFIVTLVTTWRPTEHVFVPRVDDNDISTTTIRAHIDKSTNPSTESGRN